MEQAMTDDNMRRNLAARSRYLTATYNRCCRLIWALDAFGRGENATGWEYLFMAEEFGELAEKARQEEERA
jgi:hypothetical protein